MKSAQPHTNAEPGALDSADSTVDATKRHHLTPRQTRLLNALLSTEGWVSRERVDRISGASNGPQIILEVRRKVTGHDGIEMRKESAIDRDGRPCKPGRYRLSAPGRERAIEFLSRMGLALDAADSEAVAV